LSGKRLFDIVCSFVGLVIISPLLVLLAFWIRLDSPGSVFFRQERVGRHGRMFRIHKFRTMVVDADVGSGQLTVNGDARITRTGCWLRAWKLDELPQLIDVLVGDMSLVGPRPEVPRYVSRYPEAMRECVLSVRPGITDLASIEFRNESALLDGSADPERTYVEEILPRKLDYYVRYVHERSFLGDLRILWRTIRVLVA